MISRLGIRISAIFRSFMPDPFVLAIGLTILTAILALAFGTWKGVAEDESRLVALIDSWRGPTGLWGFLSFGMQMCLILITGHAVAMTRPVRGLINQLASLPKSAAAAAALVGLIACITGALNWGLGLIVGAFMAREVGRSMSERGISAHYPLLCAAGFLGMLVWHGGFSGSAPLKMTSFEEASSIIPAQYLTGLGGEGVPLTNTVLSPMNLLITGGLILGAPLLLLLLSPKDESDIKPIENFPAAVFGQADVASRNSGDGPSSLPDRVDGSPIVVWLLVVPLVLVFFRYGWVAGGAETVESMAGKVRATLSGFGSIGLNEINVAMLALGLVLHGSVRSYMSAATDGARGCAGIIIQFPLYAGIMAMMDQSGLVEQIAIGFNKIGNETTIPLLSYLSAGVVNVFVPSGGGQWGIQGPVALETGMAAGVAPGKMIMAVAYGDQLTNMLQPFWALPLLGITGVKARDIVGYTAIIMVAAGVWIGIGLVVF